VFTPEKMKQVSLLVLKEDVDAVTETIAEDGVMHLTDFSEIEGWAQDLSAVHASEALERAGKLEKKLRELAAGIGIRDLPKTISSATQYMTLADLEEAERKVAEAEAEVSGLVVGRESKAQELEKLLKMSEELKVFAPLGGIEPGARYSFLEVVTGKVPRRNLPLIERAMEGIPCVLMPFSMEGDMVTLVALTLKRDTAALDRALQEASFEKVIPPSELSELSGDAQRTLAQKTDALRRELSTMDEEIAAARRRYRQPLQEMSERINCTKLLARARGYFRKTGSACLISGWVPEKDIPELSRALDTVTSGHCYLETRKPDEISAVRGGRVKVPVLLKNPLFIRPFELLTSAYGIPAYHATDPTIFVAITFLIMFGVMFGDIGDGLVLALLGAFLAGRRYKEQVRGIGALVLSCGLSSMVCGFLYGSFFGVERWFPPLWMRPMNNILFFIKTAIYFGVAVVSLGVLINIVDALRSRDWIKGIFDKAGMLAGVIYWGGVGLVINLLVLGGAGLSRSLVMLLVGVPVLLLFMKAPVQRLLGESAKLFPEGVMTYFMETIIEVVEIFLSFLANTLSFIRVAAFALAHAMLFMAVFTLADAVRNIPGGTLVSLLLIVVGNFLIILLEGIIVTIQAIRLEYYEFFGKFFSEEGTRYEPVKIG
jgi:V/A-type H+/Na+-transporting ATPase subunit I